MSKPREVSVSLYDDGKGRIHVWNISFKLNGSLSKRDEATIQRKQKMIEKIIEQIEIPDE